MSHEPINENSPAVQAHLTIEQSVIERMATNSASCKAWCITLVSAILIVIADKNKPNLALLAAIPVLLFFVLDAYYLGLERMFRASYRQFLAKLHEKKVVSSDLYLVVPTGDPLRTTFEAAVSFSILPFYAVLAFMVFVVKWII